ncbi:hypothetical protein Ciccas_001376 [Cichlidogyrus casuarinus]|uniref:Uncharacterized protein n=1 Tax=Cichlidogyrus casuarinus TaxID=1844966 RepID=A0ABD2QKI6_9PLAT
MKVPKLENETMPHIVHVASTQPSSTSTNNQDSCIMLSSDEEETVVSTPLNNTTTSVAITSVLPVASINSSSIRAPLLLQTAPMIRPSPVPLLRMPSSWLPRNMIPVNPYMAAPKIVGPSPLMNPMTCHMAAKQTWQSLPKLRSGRRKKNKPPTPPPPEPIVDLTSDVDAQSQASVDEELPKELEVPEQEVPEQVVPQTIEEKTEQTTVPFDEIRDVGCGRFLLGQHGYSIINGQASKSLSTDQ